MSEIPVTLINGVKVGDTVHKEAVIREELVADLISASENAEKLISTPDGYQLVSNPVMIGLLSMGQQIVRVGDVEGPFGKEMMAKLSTADLEVLRGATDALSEATLQQLKNRGRPDPSSE